MRVFLTGATGLIGGEVARRLVARGHCVTAAIHANPVVLGNDGVRVPVAGHARIDLTRAGLGLSTSAAEWIAREHDMILHCAATTRFDLPDAAYRAANVGGTAAVLELAARRELSVLHVSTAYVCGARNGVIREDDPLPASGFVNGYEASKAEAEALVAAASPRHVIARPGIVLGEHQNGHIRYFDALYKAFRLFAQGRLRHMPARSDATLDFAPIDHVAAGLVELAERMDAAAGGHFHLVSAAPIPVVQWAAAIGGYPQFHAPELVDATDFDTASLPPAERRLFTRIAAPYGSYFQRNPRFDDSRFVALTGLAPPQTGRAYIERLIDHCIAAGFLSAA